MDLSHAAARAGVHRPGRTNLPTYLYEFIGYTAPAWVPEGARRLRATGPVLLILILITLGWGAQCRPWMWSRVRLAPWPSYLTLI